MTNTTNEMLNEEVNSFLQTSKKEESLKKKLIYYNNIKQNLQRKVMETDKKLIEIINELKEIKSQAFSGE